MTDAGGAMARRRDWIGLAVLALPCALYSMDLTVLNLAIPRLSADLRPSGTELLWIIDIYGFVLAGSLITMGTLGDRIGRRRLLLAGAAAFGLVSVVASLSTSASMLIATRAALGLAGATIAPSTLALIHAMFRDPRQRLFAIGVWTAAFSAGGLFGPLLGGVVLAHYSWRVAFLLGIPVMAALLAVGPTLLPEVKADRPGRFDIPSALLSLAAILLSIYGIKAIAHGDPGVSFIALGLVVGIWFVHRQRHIADPLVDLRMFAAPALSVALATYVLAIFVVFGFYVLVAQYLQLVAGLTPLAAGVGLVPSSLGFLVGSLVTPAITRSAKPASVLAAGLVLAAIGLASVVGIGGLAGVVIGTFVLSLGLSPVAPLASAIVLGNASAQHAGAAAAVSETGAELGGALGIALLGSLGTLLYRSNAGAIGDSLADAIHRNLSAERLAEARLAFVHGFQIIAVIGATILVATAVGVVCWLPWQTERQR